MAVVGIIAFLALATALRGRHPFRAWPWRIVLGGLLVQLACILLLREGTAFYGVSRRVFAAIAESAAAGGAAAFGSQVRLSAVLALNCLAVIVMISSLMGVLYCWRLPQLLVGLLSRLFRRLFGVGGLAASTAVMNIFFGMNEVVAMVSPYVPRMTGFSFMVLMVSGLATMSVSLMPFVASLGISPGDLVCASLMSSPSSLIFAALLTPGEAMEGQGQEELPDLGAMGGGSVMEAFTRGAHTGFKIAVEIVVMLLAIISAVHVVNLLLALPHALCAGIPALSLQYLLGFPGALFAWLIGVPAGEAVQAGYILGCNVTMNEVVAYTELAKLSGTLSPRTFRIMTFACCGFANVGSLAMFYGAISAIAPGRLEECRRIMPRAILGGVLSSLTTACFAALF